MAIAIPQDFLEDTLPSNEMESGEYEVVILQHSWEEYRKIPGKDYLLLELQVSKGDFEGRKIFCRFNLYHPSQAAQAFSWHQLKELATALGQDAVSKQEIDVEAFDGAKVIAKVEVTEHEKYGKQMDVKKFSARSRSASVKPIDGMELVDDNDAVADTPKPKAEDDDLPW